jgi:hypothetical protein
LVLRYIQGTDTLTTQPEGQLKRAEAPGPGMSNILHEHAESGLQALMRAVSDVLKVRWHVQVQRSQLQPIQGWSKVQ